MSQNKDEKELSMVEDEELEEYQLDENSAFYKLCVDMLSVITRDMDDDEFEEAATGLVETARTLYSHNKDENYKDILFQENRFGHSEDATDSKAKASLPKVQESKNALQDITKKEILSLLENPSVRAVASAIDKRVYLRDSNPLIDRAILEMPFGDAFLTIDEFDSFKGNHHCTNIYVLAISCITSNFPTMSKQKRISDSDLLKHGVFSMTLDQYMDVCKLTDRNTARKNVNNALLSLSNIKFNGKMRAINGSGTKERVFNLIESYEPISNKNKGCFTLCLTQSCLEALRECGHMTFISKGILSIDSRKFPYARMIADKLTSQHRLNLKKPNAEVLSVKVLVEYLNKAGLPKHEDVMKGNRAVKERIIDAVDKNLEALVDSGVLKEYYYCKPKNEPLTDSELESINYKSWIQLNIRFKLSDEVRKAFRENRKNIDKQIEEKQKKAQTELSKMKKSTKKKATKKKS